MVDFFTGRAGSKTRWLLALCCAAAGFLVGCTSAAPTPSLQAGAARWQWPETSPEEQGIDSSRLKALLDEIESTGLPLHSVLVIRHGFLVQETYFSGYDRDSLHEQYSVTKSFISTLIGIAIDQGKIRGVDEKVLSFFPDENFENLDARKESLTLEQILSMSSGLDWGESENDFSTLVQSSNWAKFMLDKPILEEPGSHFNYCSGCSHILSAILHAALGSDVLEYARQELFQPLGITDFTWETDAQGLPVGGWGLKLTPRDMARFGYLFLHEGTWDGQTVVSPAWVKAATQKSIFAEENWDYGYHWWIYPTLKAYSAIGRGGQTVVVIPDLDLIVVTTAALPNSDPVFDLIERYVIPAVKP